MKNFYLFTFFLLLSSCQIKDAFESIKAENLNQTEMGAEMAHAEMNNDWQFLGNYTGEKEEENNQQLTYKLFLWELDHQLKGYIYKMWYVTDFNYVEYHSLLEGRPKQKGIILKGHFDNEPVVITIHDSIMPEINISLRYPTNSSASVNDVILRLNKESQKTPSIHMHGEAAMKKAMDSLMSLQMDHRGY